jgi:hypothetical protein
MFTPNLSPGSWRWTLVRAANPLVRIRGGIVGGAFRRVAVIGDSLGSDARNDIRSFAVGEGIVAVRSQGKARHFA